MVSKEGVTKLLKGSNLNPSKALGPDELHPRVLKELASELGPVFAHLFQQSIDMGEMPKEWSLANICPLFKKADRSLACNYRTVSLTCIPCKLLEHIVCSNIMSHLDHHKLLSDRQHAFRKSHSCETQLATVIDDWAKILDNQGQVDTFILDFEKAFDTPLHELLKSKLFSYGIGGKTIKWIDAFLNAIDNKELWLMALNQTGFLLYLVSHRAPFLAPCCFRCILMISPQILNRKSDSLLMIVFVIVKL